MASEIFLAGAIVLQITAAVLAFRLIRVTGRLSAWILVSIALVLMAVRRIIPFIRALLGNDSSSIDPLNEFIGLVLSGFMVVGIAMIGPIFKKIFQSERELKESEQRFRSYFELPLVGVAIVSEDKHWLTVNDRLCEMLAFSRQELMTMTTDELTYPEDLKRERVLDRSVVEGNSDGYYLDKRFVRKDGDIIWTSQAVRCVRDPEGAINYVALILQDITKRKQTETALQESEVLYRSVVTAMAEGIFLQDASGKILAVNAATERIIGRSADRILGRTLQDLQWQAQCENGEPFLKSFSPRW